MSRTGGYGRDKPSRPRPARGRQVRGCGALQPFDSLQRRACIAYAQLGLPELGAFERSVELRHVVALRDEPSLAGQRLDPTADLECQHPMLTRLEHAELVRKGHLVRTRRQLAGRHERGGRLDGRAETASEQDPGERNPRCSCSAGTAQIMPLQ